MLTKTTIDQAQPQAAAYVLWDEALGGFGCRVFPSGRRSFIVQYRLPGSRRTVSQTLGPYGLLTVTEARTTARKVLGQARAGADPLAAKKARRAAEAAQASALTVTKLIEHYTAAMEDGTASTGWRRGRRPTPGYIEANVRCLTRFAATCGTQDAAGVTRADVARAMAPHAHYPAGHYYMRGAIICMYRWAMRQELVSSNPAEHVAAVAPMSRDHILTLAEMARVWRAADTLAAAPRDVVRLLMTTGQRFSEVAGMTWGEIDLAQALWTLPAARTKAGRVHVVPLPSLAVAIFQARRASFQRDPAPAELVSPIIARDRHSIVPISNGGSFKLKLDCATGLTNWRLHDFRRSLVSLCAEHGADIAVLDSILNHAASATRSGVLGVYQRATLIEPMRKVMALWNSLLTTAIDPAATDTQTVPLRSASAAS